MPASRSPKGKQNREFLKLKDYYIKDNYLKWFDIAVKHFSKVTEITGAQLMFMLFIYDYEFFTMSRVAKDYGRSTKKLYERTLLPLKQLGYVEDFYSSGLVSKEVEQTFGITQRKTRYALSHKGRHAVQRFYRMVDGREPISYHPTTK